MAEYFTIFARSVRLLPTHMLEDVHATHQLHCQCHAKHAENAASVYNTCLDKIVFYLQRIFNRNRKLKQQVRK